MNKAYLSVKIYIVRKHMPGGGGNDPKGSVSGERSYFEEVKLYEV